MLSSTSSSRNPQRLIAAFALGLLFFGSAAAAAAQEIAQSAQLQISALLAEKASRTPAQAKIDSHLLHAALVVSGQALDPALPPLAGEVKAVRADANNMVEVDIRASVTDDLLGAIRAAGGRVVSSFPEYDAVRARLPLARLESIAGRAGVSQIRAAEGWRVDGAVGLNAARTGLAASGQAVRERLARYLNMPAMRFAGLLPALSTTLFAGQTNAAGQGVDTWGDTAMAADTARANFGFDGTGVRVGVLSDGVDSLAAEISAGRLGSGTAAIAVNNVVQSGSGDEGTAMLEVVHSLAPGATLYFATANGSPAQMATNIKALAAAPYNCNVIVDDVTYFGEGVFQDGAVAKAVNQVAGAGVFYFSSAGNNGNVINGTSGTWQGDFYDSHTTISAVAAAETSHSKSATVSIHSFDNGATNYNVLSTLSPASWADATQHVGHYELKWSDPLGASNNDYDLFILNQAMTQVLDSSTSVQNGSQDPEESIGDNSNLSACTSTAPCRVVIAKSSAAATLTLYLDTERGVLAHGTRGATFGHNATSGAFSVAATDARAACYPSENRCGPFTVTNISQWAARYTPQHLGGVEIFTSDGPRLMYFNSSGTALTPNKFTIAANGGQTLNKPDLTAADCVPTGVSGFATFCGTSAAAPHAAALAALMLQAKPTATATDVTAAGNMLAVSGSSGWNEDSGNGLLMADKSINTLCGFSASGPSVVPATGGTYSLTISANPGCAWNVISANWPSWINMSVRSGVSAGSDTFTVSPNTTNASRSVTLLAAGTSITITQPAQAAAAVAIATTQSNMLSGYVGAYYSLAFTASSGTAPYTWSLASGSLPAGLALSSAGAITGTPTFAGASTFTVRVTDGAASTTTAAFSITIYAASGTMAAVGVLGQFAAGPLAGGNYDTSIWVSNTNPTTPAQVTLVFHPDASMSATIPVTTTQQGEVQNLTLSQYSTVIAPNTTMAITSGLGAAALSALWQGWVEVRSNAAVSGFAVFRFAFKGFNSNVEDFVTPWEGTVPLQTNLAATTLILPFDNTNGFSTGIAIGTLSASTATITAKIYDPNGNSLGTPTFTLPGNGHTAFMANAVTTINGGSADFSGAAGKSGVIVFTGPAGLIGVGLRASGYGTLTAVPVTAQ